DHFQTQGTVATGLQPEFPPLAPPSIKTQIGANGMPGGMLSLALDPSKPGKGVLFASVKRCRTVGDPAQPFQECSKDRCTKADTECGSQDYGMLRAFNPMTMAELWNDQLDAQAGNYWYAKWVPPTIAGGRVFLATWSDKVLVFGKLDQ